MNLYLQHISGEVYAVQIDSNNTVVSASIDLPHDEVTATNIESYNFDSEPEQVAWINANRREFHTIEPYDTRGLSTPKRGAPRGNQNASRTPGSWPRQRLMVSFDDDLLRKAQRYFVSKGELLDTPELVAARLRVLGYELLEKEVS